MRHLDPFKDIVVIARVGSIRKAAEILNISPTALNRRLLAMEADFGVQIFERLPKGLRLSSSGELIIRHMRNQLSQHDYLISQIDNLSGLRSGHVSIACSQALLPHFLPEQIATFRTAHPDVTFSVRLRDRGMAESSLQDHSADIAVVLEPMNLSVFQNELTVGQPVWCLMREQHPLAAKNTIRLGECSEYHVALPEPSYGVRFLMDRTHMTSIYGLKPVVEADSFEFLRGLSEYEDVLTFHIPISLPAKPPPGMVYRPLDPRDVAEGRLSIGYLKGRTLPVAAASFLEHVCRALGERHGDLVKA
ncbi:LysR family transcriptional regulator [Silicimonas algicola]|uniref:DNA-binding transcriptional LysR family regulator n=1 Tax=Silicimonas algicola TaxID=1826607 RepID=A0A316FXR9_9RHOB|nr:LysR family transcriptional regulator [Silicimonas algicola]AZQ66735.1 LysR family transcriptional regulator [Silicimonas algicola]PWK53152.1 DNA-binding transcriptional LysR family regulator [Silicimonas algicola]